MCLNGGRNPYDLTRVLADKPNKPLIDLLELLSNFTYIIFFSGREATDQCREDTMKWISTHVSFPYQLYMRKQGDYRPDEVIKEELFKENIENNYYCIAVFDDRNRVIKK